MVVAASIFCQTLLSTARLRHVNRENVLAVRPSERKTAVM
jgi:hypothetical protein